MSENQAKRKTPFKFKGFSVGMVFTFDLGMEDKVKLNSPSTIERLKSFSNGIYVVSQNEFHSFTNDDNEISILRAYKDEMYLKRFKNSVLSQRNSLLIQFPNQTISGLIFNNNEFISKDRVINVGCTATLHQMGVGSIAFWLDLENTIEFDYQKASFLQNATKLKSEVDWRSGLNNELRITGTYNFIELVRFRIISLFSGLYDKPKFSHIKHSLDSNENLIDIHRKYCDSISSIMRINEEIEFYPILHINFKNVKRMNDSSTEKFILDNYEKVRGLVTKDKNWDKKKKEVIDTFSVTHSFSTRDSLHWFTHPNGSLKVYSSNMTTSILTSKLLITFELELILTMKHFIYKIIRNLNHFTNLSEGSYPLKSIAKLRDREMRRLDEFYNLDFVQKDTTAKRLSKFKNIFRIDDIQNIAVRKFESLNLYMATEYQSSAAKRQLALTIVFGVFGAGALVFHILKKSHEIGVFPIIPNYPVYEIITIVVITLISMGLTGYVMYKYFGKDKIN